MKHMLQRDWVKHEDPSNRYGASFTLGNRDMPLPEGAVVSVTRGESFNIPRLIINGLLNQFIMKSMRNNPNLLYAELTGQLQGGIGQTLTVWRHGTDMNRFRTEGWHQFSRRFFRWVFYSGNVQAYFYTWKLTGTIPSSEEATAYVKTHGRHYDGGKLVKEAK
jgi:hypothetical protein